MMNNHALLGPLHILALLSQTQSPYLSRAPHCEPVSLLDFSPVISVFSGYFWALFQPTQLRCLSRLVFGVSQSTSRDLALPSSGLCPLGGPSRNTGSLLYPPKSLTCILQPLVCSQVDALNPQGGVSSWGCPGVLVNLIFPVHALGYPDSVILRLILFFREVQGGR